LAKVKKLWEKYQEEVQPLPTLLSFLYNNPLKEPKKLDPFNQAILSLRSVARPASKDEYKDYNSQELYNPEKKGALI
jgi:hypothetical protein